MVVVEGYLLDHAHAHAVGIDGTADADAADVGEARIVVIVRREHREPLQVVHAEKEHYDGHQGHQGYFHFVSKEFHCYIL